ncbi:MAG: efflux RND transporter periplasmic adaptor subunit [Armatimonadetes bacterium]|nr:efflux RND transporter periplasmic adaptor subunit [Armatimonadota bacterium]
MVAVGILALAVVGCGKREQAVPETPLTVSRGDVSITIIESGTVEAVKTVEAKPQVTGRIAKLYVDEGSVVKVGDLLAVIDPKPTQLQLDSNKAQLMGAQSQVDRATIEISQRKKTAKASVEEAQARVAQLELELKTSPTLLQADIAQAQANLEASIQDRDRLVKNSQPTQLATAKSNLDQADQNLKNAEIDYNRQQDLLKQGYVAAKVVENAKLTLDNARSRYLEAKVAYDRTDAGFAADLARADETIKANRAALKRAQANLYTLKTKKQDLVTAQAQLDSAKASLADPALLEKGKLQNEATVMQLQSSLAETERLMRETQVRSPISGIVTKRLLQEGENATGLGQFGSGSTIVRIEDRTQMRVKLAVNEIDVARLSIGMPAEINVDAIPGKTLTGKISKIAPARQVVEGTTTLVGSDTVVKYEVEIMLDSVDPALKSGMSAKCTMPVANKKNVVFLPIEYTEKDGNDYYAYFPAANPKDPKSKPERKKLKVGLVTSSRVEILDGVKEGDKVVKPEFKGPSRKGFMQMGPDDDSSSSNNSSSGNGNGSGNGASGGSSGGGGASKGGGDKK